MFRLSEVPSWYLLVAILVSCYQAYRGFMFQWILGIKAIDTKVQRVILLCLADTFTYLLSTMSGFISLFFFYQLTSQQSDFAKDPGGSALLIFLVLYGILGVTGKLPDLLHSIKFPGTG
jgi:hypothetical protein